MWAAGRGIKREGVYDVMERKTTKIYRQQKGRDARERWSSVCGGLCTRPPDRRSSADDVLRTGRTAAQKKRWDCFSFSCSNNCSGNKRKKGIEVDIPAHPTEGWSWVLPPARGSQVSSAPVGWWTCRLHRPGEGRTSKSLVKSRQIGKTLLARKQNTHIYIYMGSSQAPWDKTWIAKQQNFT